MQKSNSVQLEMFKTDDDASLSQGESGRNFSRLKKIRGYQKVVYTFVAFIFVSLVSFSLGVEKGKRRLAGIIPAAGIEPVSSSRAESTSSLPAQQDQAVPSRQGPVLLVNKNTALVQEKAVSSDKKTEKNNLLAKPSVKAVKESTRASYTIQVASIANVKNVDRELSRLKDKGYSAFSLTKGKYIVICVGRFNIKEDAQINLVKMKSSYPDCQIRRL